MGLKPRIPNTDALTVILLTADQTIWTADMTAPLADGLWESQATGPTTPTATPRLTATPGIDED